MDADASTLNGFGGETISPVDTFLLQYHLAEMDPRQAEPQLVRNGVCSHLIGRPATLARYESLPEWQRILGIGQARRAGTRGPGQPRRPPAGPDHRVDRVERSV